MSNVIGISYKKAPLKEIAEVITGNTPSKKRLNDFYGGNIPFITPTSLGKSIPILNPESSLTELGATKARCLPPESVLVCCIGSLGKIGYLGTKAATNQQINAVIFNKNIIFPKYGFYALKNLKKEIISLGSSTTVPIVNKSRFEKLEISFPPLDEQRRIAMLLDRANDNISLANLRQVKLQGLIQNIFANAFTQSSLFHSEWPIYPLSEIVKKGTIVTYGIVQAGDEYPGGIPYIRTGDIINNQISLNGLRHTSPEIASRFKRSTVYENEIVMSIRATVGTTALVPKILDGSNLTQGTARIAPGEKVTSEYLLHFLRSPKTQNWIKRQVKGATFREITLTRLRELPVVIPPISIQRDFSKKVKKYNELLTTVSNYKNLLNEFYQSLEFNLINSSK